MQWVEMELSSPRKVDKSVLKASPFETIPPSTITRHHLRLKNDKESDAI